MTTAPPQLPPLPDNFDWEVFRREGHKVIDFIADYHQQLKKRDIPVHPTVATGAGFLPVAMGLGADPPLPQQSQPFDKTLSQIQQGVIPGMLHWQHPDFFGYFPAQLTPSAMLGEMLGTAMNTPGFSWQSAPSASEMEKLVMKWIVELFGLPKDMSFEGTGGAVLQPSATEATIVAILAAKNKKLDAAQTVEEKATIAGKLVVYVSDQAHFCIEKASKVVGIPYCRKIESETSNEHFVGNRKINVAALKASVEADVAGGLVPCFVAVNFGATGICAIDDIEKVSETITKPNSIWLHVDGAYAGVVAMLPEFRHMTSNAFACADSLVINASKWMATMSNASMFFFKERAPIVASLNATAEYLKNDFTASGAVIDFKDYQLGQARPFRSIKLYTTLQSLGAEGLSNGLRRHIKLAKYLWETLKVRNEEEFGGQLFGFPVEPLFGLVCFTLPNKSEAEAIAILKALNASNKLFAVHCVVDKQVVFRISLAYPSLEVCDMDRLADILVDGIGNYKSKSSE